MHGCMSSLIVVDMLSLLQITFPEPEFAPPYFALCKEIWGEINKNALIKELQLI